MDIERFVADYLIGPPFRVLGFLLSPLSSLVGRQIAKSDRRRLESDMKALLPFLFTKYHGQVVPSVGLPDPPGFDYAFATIALDDIFIRVCRGRGELDVRIASSQKPDEWFDLLSVVEAVDGENPPQRHGAMSMQNVGRLLDSNISLIQAAFHVDDPAFRQRLSGARIRERIEIKEAEWQINKRLR